ncbi:TatA/E family twin arginine-targeting protein translocase [Alkalinema sp. FACHB-956]|uniref:TatA/E family twin arginine-targeting protein translocase n=1 Tax=Alkalinema sp. FACHB-956 TaxID=2692768 RepID=UPI001681C9DE|nr:TatA/E family twin arginine-targeting protein translocase [Alkalinema sp. FACHB-956]MBD2327497.1 TatA/E family twin arginine-targeting protein translocase [Alkalinema sp. FACHB-956]
MNVFGIGLPEMVLIFVLALLVFGPKKLPEIGKTLGKTLRGFQDASKEFENEFKKASEQVEQAVNAPMKATLEDKPSLSPASDVTDATVIETSADAATSPDASNPQETADASKSA